MTDATTGALLSVLRSIHQAAEAAMQLLMEAPAPVQQDKPKRRYMGDTDATPPATTPPEGPA